jgi:hypothetical protein
MKEGKKVYPVRAVLGPEYVSNQDRFFFKTEWEEKKANGEHEISNIPLESFIDTPLPIFEYGKKERQPNAGLKKILSRRLCPKAYIPTGQEFVRKIYYSSPQKSGRTTRSSTTCVSAVTSVSTSCASCSWNTTSHENSCSTGFGIR